MTPRHSPLSLTRLQRWEVNQVRSESVDDGAESKTISPGLRHVDDLYSRISLGHSLTPDLQTCRSCHQHCLLKQVRFNWETETKCCVIKIMFYDQIVMIIHLSVHAILEIIFRLFTAAMSDMISEPVILVKISIETWRSESVKSSSPLLVLLIICPDKPQFPVSGQMIETCSHVISVTDHQLLITGPHHSHQWTRVWPWIRASVGSAPANQNITPSPVDKDKR